ncbi:MAG: PEP-CTERM sorting domain-containing protein [Phycisphaerae bacterium]
MRGSLRTSKAWLGVSAVVACLAVAPAQAVLLSDLVSGAGSIVIGDKKFTNFTVTITGIAPYTAVPANIEVTGVVSGSGDYGLKFTSANPSTAMIWADPVSGFVDVLLGFDAIAADPFTIIAADLSFVGNAPNDGLVQIVETVQGDDDQLNLTLLMVSTLGASSATAVLPKPEGYKLVHVVKDIAVVAGETTGASLNEFTQFFIQIPEPATISLLVFGGLALFGRALARKRGLLTVAIILMGLGGMLAQPGTASAVMLSTLTANPANAVNYGDLKFDNFQFNAVGSGKWIADDDAIDVQGFTTPSSSEDGLRFAGLIAALSNATPGSQVTVTISYDVALTTPGLLFHDVTMSFNGAPTSWDGSAKVSKTIETIGEVAKVYNRPSDPDPIKLIDHQVIGAGNYPGPLHVIDTIVVEGGRGGATMISYINQTFSLIPEPAMLILTMLGLPLVVGRRRKR